MFNGTKYHRSGLVKAIGESGVNPGLGRKFGGSVEAESAMTTEPFKSLQRLKVS